MLTLFSVLETLTAVVQNTALFLESWYQACCLPGALVFGTHMHTCSIQYCSNNVLLTTHEVAWYIIMVVSVCPSVCL